MRVTPAKRLTLLASAALVVAALPASAHASLMASTSIQTSASVTRIVVQLSSSTKLAARRKPRTVSVRAGRKTYRLSRVGGTSAAAFSLGTWRSVGLKGSAGAAVLALQGTHVTVLIRTAGGATSSLGSDIPKPVGGTGTTGPPAPTSPTPTPPAGAQSLFKAPSRALTGNEAFNSISQYFLGSEFSDCVGGRWPLCSVENRYEHGSAGAFEYHRCTPSSGSDINFYDSFYVTGVEQAADGSWKIEYATQNGKGFYHWEVSTAGAVSGYYIFNGGPPEQLLGLVWRQPAHLGDCYS